MKKFLLILAMLSFVSSSAFAVSAPNSSIGARALMQPPTAGNRAFGPMMQRQMEKQETLDFINDSENYKEKRAKKDAQLDYLEGKTNVNPYLNLNSLKNHSKFQNKTTLPTSMEFSQNSNGDIIIKGTN